MTRNPGASVRDRIPALAKERSEANEYLLLRYANERFLYRLRRSPFAAQLVLKGATGLALTLGNAHRPTRDLDLTVLGRANAGEIEEMITTICTIECAGDGVVFDTGTLQTTPIMEHGGSPGLSLTFDGAIAGARPRLRVDVSVGQAVNPVPVRVSLPPLLAGMPPPEVLACPKETIVAEKFEVIVSHGLFNSRLKDYFDITSLARGVSFEGPRLAGAIEATFRVRGTAIPRVTPPGLTREFRDAKGRDWEAFHAKLRLPCEPGSLQWTCELIERFVMPPCLSAADGREFQGDWTPGGPWR